jgi:hypothetical protein
MHRDDLRIGAMSFIVVSFIAMSLVVTSLLLGLAVMTAGSCWAQNNAGLEASPKAGQQQAGKAVGGPGGLPDRRLQGSLCDRAGCRLRSEVWHQRSGRDIPRVVCSSDRRQHRKAEQIRSVAKNVTLYASAADKALLASGEKSYGTRLGFVGPSGPNIFPGIEVIDVTAVGDDMLGLDHGTFASAVLWRISDA